MINHPDQHVGTPVNQILKLTMKCFAQPQNATEIAEIMLLFPPKCREIYKLFVNSISDNLRTWEDSKFYINFI